MSPSYDSRDTEPEKLAGFLGQVLISLIGMSLPIQMFSNAVSDIQAIHLHGSNQLRALVA